MAAVRRRVRSSKCGQIARNFAVSSGRVLTLEQHNASKYGAGVTRWIPLFIYNALVGRCVQLELGRICLLRTIEQREVSIRILLFQGEPLMNANSQPPRQRVPLWRSITEISL